MNGFASILVMDNSTALIYSLIGGVVALLIIVTIVVVLLLRRRNSNSNNNNIDNPSKFNDNVVAMKKLGEKGFYFNFVFCEINCVFLLLDPTYGQSSFHSSEVVESSAKNQSAQYGETSLARKIE